MLDAIRNFIKTLRDEGSDHRPLASDPDIAAMALCFHVMGADGTITPDEMERLRDVVASDYGRSGKEIKQLLAQAEEASRESVDFYAFTSVLNRRLDEAGKVSFIELLFDLAFADGRKHELEEHVVWRISDLMGVSTRDRVFARQRVGERRAPGEEGDDVDET